LEQIYFTAVTKLLFKVIKPYADAAVIGWITWTTRSLKPQTDLQPLTHLLRLKSILTEADRCEVFVISSELSNKSRACKKSSFCTWL